VLATPSSQWQVGQIVSDGPWNVALSSSLPDGDYDWLMGLFDLNGDGSRVPLQGVDDGTRRIRLGMLRLANAGTVLAFTPETNAPAFDPGAWYVRHLNTSNSIVDFGDACTDGSVWLRREGNSWLLKTWPRERSFTLEFSRARFGQPATVRCTGGTATEVTPLERDGHRGHAIGCRLPLASAPQRRQRIPLDQCASTPVDCPHERGDSDFLAGLGGELWARGHNQSDVEQQLVPRTRPRSEYERLDERDLAGQWGRAIPKAPVLSLPKGSWPIWSRRSELRKSALRSRTGGRGKALFHGCYADFCYFPVRNLTA
jgi:hypothetical protein